MDRLYKLVIVGLGLIGIRHLQAINAASNVAVAAIVDTTEKSKEVAKQYDIPHFLSMDELFASVKPDGIIIATPNELHVPLARQCIEQGIPTLIEKPLAIEVESAEAMLSFAEERNVPILTGYCRRYNPLVSAAKSQIAAGALGEIVSVHSNVWLYKPPQYFHVKWRTEKQGGPIYINLVHEIDLLQHLIADIQEVTTYASNKVRGLNVEDSAVIMCKFKNGALGTINVSDTIPAPWSWELTAGENPAYPHTDKNYCFIGGTKGSLEFPKSKRWYYEEGGHWYTPINTQIFTKNIQDPLIAQIEHFMKVISGQEQPLVSGEDGLKVMKVINAIKESSFNNQTITVQ